MEDCMVLWDIPVDGIGVNHYFNHLYLCSCEIRDGQTFDLGVGRERLGYSELQSFAFGNIESTKQTNNCSVCPHCRNIL